MEVKPAPLGAWHNRQNIKQKNALPKINIPNPNYFNTLFAILKIQKSSGAPLLGIHYEDTLIVI